MHASYLTDNQLPVLQIATDVSDFFNQHRLHPSEVPRVGLITLDLDLLLRAVGRLRRHEPSFCNVADLVLGYGLYFASQIGQRHAYLLTFLWLVEMLKECGPTVDALCARYPALTSWMNDRRQLLEPPDNPLDPTERVRFGQAQFFAMSMYSDDAHQKILSVELTVLGLRCWLKITSSLQLTMAIVQKQMIGQFITNQGLRFHSGFGIAYVLPTSPTTSSGGRSLASPKPPQARSPSATITPSSGCFNPSSSSWGYGVPPLSGCGSPSRPETSTQSTFSHPPPPSASGWPSGNLA